MEQHRIRHVTRYTYPAPVADSANQIMLYPLNDAQQRVLRQTVSISGKPAVELFADYFGNTVGTFTVIAPHRELIIDSSLEVQTEAAAIPPDGGGAAAQWERIREISRAFPYLDFLTPSRSTSRKEILEVARAALLPARSPLEVINDLSAYVHEHLQYRKGVTTVETSVDEVWNLKAGVCQDFAHLLLFMLRGAGIPARYVSGYVCPKNHDMRGEGATHAWVEAFIPDFGWLGIDPTNNSLVGERHVRLAVGRGFSDCTPVKGTYKGSGQHTLEVSVVIENGFQSDEALPEFSYTVTKSEPNTNSYRRYLEAQQQQ